MTNSSPPQHSEKIFENNIAALRAVDADLADRLAKMRLPLEVVAATGRDGSATYRMRTADGERWFGFTSMPTVSGPALLANFDPGDGNVLLAGIGQGIEARLISERLGSNRAVFVLERDPLPLALALRLHDLADPIERGRLLLIAADDLGGALVRFLVDHEGYTAPGRMLAWPWLSQTDVEAMKGLLQRASARAASDRADKMAAALQVLAEAYPERRPLPDRPRTMIVCPHADDRACEFAADVLSGLKDLDWPGEGRLGNTPGAAHPLALARQMAAFRPDMVVLMDSVRAAFSRVLPPSMPVVSWFTSYARLGTTVADGIGADDYVFAMTDGVREDLIAAGLDPTRIQRLAPAVPESMTGQLGDRAPDHDVVAVADAFRLDASAQGMTLSSHQALWDIATQTIRDDVERYTDRDVARILERTEAKTGASFEDEAFRQDISHRINYVLGQTIVRQSVFEAVVDAGIDLAIYGTGWQGHPTLSPACRGPVPTGRRADVYASAKLVLHVDVSGNVTADLLTAAASGAVVVARAHPTDQGDFGLCHLLAPGQDLLTFNDHKELVGHLKQLLGDDPTRQAMADRARGRIAEAHTTAHRLVSIRAAMTRTDRATG
jgi:hypothetical protein